MEQAARAPKQEITSLLDLSARLGADPLLIQANNGNTSVKLDDLLWVKASGKCLAAAQQEEMFIPVELSLIERSLRRNVDVAQAWAPGSRLRPSIETSMHAVLPHRAVVHVHSVNTIAWAIRRDAPARLGERLAGLNWQWVPYVRSGIPLARAIERALSAASDTNIFILGNHGLVLCADDCESAEALLADVERRLAIAPRPAPEHDPTLLTVLSGSPQWRIPEVAALHALGTDPISRAILKKGVLYPCQAMFLGREIAMLLHPAPLSWFPEEDAQPYAILEGAGVIVNEKITSAEYATLMGLMEVVQRTDESAPLRYLTPEEITGVLSGGVTGYRDMTIPAVRDAAVR